MTKRARFATLTVISMIVDNFCLLQQYEIKQSQNTIAAIDHKHARLQNSPYFCVFKYVRAVKQRVWNDAQNSKRDWGETLKIKSFFFFLSLASNARPIGVRMWDSLALRASESCATLLRKKRTVLQSITACQFVTMHSWICLYWTWEISIHECK